MQLRKLVFVIAVAIGSAGCVGHRSFKAVCWAGDGDVDGNLDGMEIDISDPCYSLESCQPDFVRGLVVQWPEDK